MNVWWLKSIFKWWFHRRTDHGFNHLVGHLQIDISAGICIRIADDCADTGLTDLRKVRLLLNKRSLKFMRVISITMSVCFSSTASEILLT